jgi:hypothetical protein
MRGNFLGYMLVLHMLINGCGDISVLGACIPINNGTALAMITNLGEAGWFR